MRYAFLALLANAPAHGYEIKQAFDKTFGEVWPPINFGQIYSTLSRLERDGLVESQHVAQTSQRDKRVYSLTSEGREELEAWANSPTEGPRLKDEFFMKLVLSKLVGVADPESLIEQQRRTYLQTLRELNLAATRYEADRDVIPSLLIEGAALHLQADLEWLDLLEEELINGQQART